jgi:hypothetical protein
VRREEGEFGGRAGEEDEGESMFLVRLLGEGNSALGAGERVDGTSEVHGLGSLNQPEREVGEGSWRPGTFAQIAGAWCARLRFNSPS